MPFIFKKFIHWVYRISIFFFWFLVACILYSNSVILSYKSAVFHEMNQLPNRKVAFVFGGGMKPDGSMSDLQTDRVIQGINLYTAGKVEKLIMTGDDGRRHDDEVHAMARYAIDHGVPFEAVALDPGGLRTYESCYNARTQFGLTEMIAVSQSFHLPRIIYMCRAMGVDTVGFAADLREYNISSTIWTIDIREVLARLKAWVEIGVLDKVPKM